MQTIIRQASIDDKIAIWDFIKVAYGDHAKDKIPDRWNWMLLENPLINKDWKELPIFVAIKDGHVIGQINEILCHIKIGEDVYQIAAGVDLIVLPQYRRERVAQQIIKAVSEHYKLHYTIVRSGITTNIIDNFKELEYHQFGTIPIFWRLVKLTGESVFRFLIEKTNKYLWMKSIFQFGCRFGLDKIISVLVNFLIEIRDLFEQVKKKEFRSEIKEIERFGDDIDQLWKAISNKFKIIVKRDQLFLNWRFSKNTQLNYRKFISRRNGETKGYIVVRKPESIELNVGIIVDLFAAPDDNDTIESLISHAINFFDKSVLAIECPTSLQEYQHVLLKLGFLKIGKTVPFFRCFDPKLRTKLEEWKNCWFITKADHDWDQLRPM